MQEKKLSLVIATYNRGAKLAVTLDSLLAQTLPQELWEVVVVNNNSTDDTAERFAAYAAAHPELDVRMVRETEQGVSAARNRGIAESRGEYSWSSTTTSGWCPGSSHAITSCSSRDPVR